MLIEQYSQPTGQLVTELHQRRHRLEVLAAQRLADGGVDQADLRAGLTQERGPRFVTEPRWASATSASANILTCSTAKVVEPDSGEPSLLAGRSFVTNARRRGVPESVYNIVREDDLREAVKKIEAGIASDFGHVLDTFEKPAD